MAEETLEIIAVNPKVMAGKPVIRGTRIPVEMILRMLAQGLPESEILREYPRLKPEDIRAALFYVHTFLPTKTFFLWPYRTEAFPL